MTNDALTTSDIARGIETFLQRNFPALHDEQFEAAHFAWLSCLTADRADHRFDITQKMHRQSLARFAETCGGLS